jgi:hypothetical protein
VTPDAAKNEVEKLRQRGTIIDLVELNGQCYALTAVEAIVPPWDSWKYEIAIAVPAAFDNAALDGFYMRLPYKWNDKDHPRVNGGVIDLKGTQWKLVSWHYADGKNWIRGQDCLETHIMHCRGFFLHRGARNDYR